MQRQALAATPQHDLVRAPTPRPDPAASSSPAERTPCWDRPTVSAERQVPAAAPSPGWAWGPLLALAWAPESVAARQPLRLSPGPAASSPLAEQTPCWDRRDAAAAEQRAPPATLPPDSVPGSVLASAPAPVTAQRPLLVSSAPAASSPPAERTPCWDRRDVAAQRQVPLATHLPDLGSGSVRASALAPVTARQPLLVSPAPAASSLPAERTPCWGRRDVAAQRQALAEPPSLRSMRAVMVREPAAARQPGPAPPNRAAARRLCSDRLGVVAQRQVPEQVRLQARRSRLERGAMAEPRLAPARHFPERHSLV
jgi:hypothetical protein